MATTATITPTLGAAPVTLQAGNYSAIDDRRFWSSGVDMEGAVSSGSYKVIQRAAGANMTVDVQSSTGDGAIVQGDSVTAQGRYFVPPTAANVNVDITAADATNPRNDLVVLEVKDDQHDAGGLNLARVRVITGTPNASAALTDAPGANGTPALPSSCLLLAVVRVAAAASSIATAAISDRRAYLPSAGWQSYTPAWTSTGTAPAIGNGTITGEYTQIGKTVIGRATLVFGSTSTFGTGNYRVSLPVTAVSTPGSAAPLGITSATDAGVASYIGVPYYVSTTTCGFFRHDGSNLWGPTVPFTFGSGDDIRVSFQYEAA